MRTIAHISDLHFGREDKRVQEGLLEDLDRLKPSLVIVSGDLTQRALLRQFRLARTYLSRIPFPLLVVPGNHDIPFFDVSRRFLLPLYRYKYFISNDLNPVYVDDEMSVLGINTARRLTVQNGRISKKQIAQMDEFFSHTPERALRIVVTHHPFVRPPEEYRHKRVIKGASASLTSMEKAKVDLVLAGHFHNSFVGDACAYYPHVKRRVILAQAGTAISKRIRREANTYNFLSITPDEIVVTVRGWQEDAFQKVNEHIYAR